MFHTTELCGVKSLDDRGVEQQTLDKLLKLNQRICVKQPTVENTAAANLKLFMRTVVPTLPGSSRGAVFWTDCREQKNNRFTQARRH